MMESDCEVEYLDEDADIVQQCFQTSLTQESLNTTAGFEAKQTPATPLLVERHEKGNRRRKKDSDDSDYYPSDEYPPSPPSPKTKIKKSSAKKMKTATDRFRTPETKSKPITSASSLKNVKKIIKENKPLTAKEQFLIRKKLSIKIPDYDDPLCLPVKAMKAKGNELKRLNVWNNVCMEHFKHCDAMLRPERGETKSSTRSVVLRNVANKQTGTIETTIWSKTSVENTDGDRKSEIFQCVLPKYKEKTTLNVCAVNSYRRSRPVTVVDEVLLTKEDHKDGETLVVYKPKEAISSVYMLFDKRKIEQEEGAGEGAGGGGGREAQLYLREAACARACAACYHASWRGVRAHDTKSLSCPVCSRPSPSLPALLAHARAHAAADVRRHRRAFAATLAQIVEYHYKCRICLEKCDSIKQLRKHLQSHQGSEIFVCEIGNHLAK